MQQQEMTCIACPMGCRMTVRRAADGALAVEGATCKRGIAYGTQEFTCPERTVTSTVRIQDGKQPLCAVKTKEPVPKARIPDVLASIQRAVPRAPVQIGDVIIPDIAGTGVDLVATASCEAAG